MLCPLFLLSLPAVAADSAVFAYDRGADLAVERVDTVRHPHAEVIDLRFAAWPGAAGADRTAAYLVRPVDRDARAAILWGHWLGEPATTNRTQFLEEALAFAERGVASLLVETMWARPHWYEERVLDDDFENGVRQVVAFRRALDLLQQEIPLPLERVAFVGHDYSAMYGAVALAVDGRVRRAVLIAPTASFDDWAFFRAQPASMDAYRAENAPLALELHLAALPVDGAVLLQFAGRDRYVPAAKAEAVAAAVRGRRTVRHYPEAEHDMTQPGEIRADREAWLVDVLGLSDPKR